MRRGDAPDPTVDIADQPTVVWVIESGSYEQHHVDFVASSPQKALEVLQAVYGPPYRVQWRWTATRDEYHELEGTFASVPRLSVAHTECFEMTRYRLDRCGSD